jgi:hypothetical protein
MSEDSEGPAEEDSTTVAAPIGVGPMSPTVVGVDEVVRVDDGDAGDELVLNKDEGGGRRRGSGERAAAAPRKKSWHVVVFTMTFVKLQVPQLSFFNAVMKCHKCNDDPRLLLTRVTRCFL